MVQCSGSRLQVMPLRRSWSFSSRQLLGASNNNLWFAGNMIWEVFGEHSGIFAICSAKPVTDREFDLFTFKSNLVIGLGVPTWPIRRGRTDKALTLKMDPLYVKASKAAK